MGNIFTSMTEIKELDVIYSFFGGSNTPLETSPFLLKQTPTQVFLDSHSRNTPPPQIRFSSLVTQTRWDQLTIHKRYQSPPLKKHPPLLSPPPAH